MLAGSSLYLLRSGRYLYMEWADVQPETVYECGSWSLSDAVLTLRPTVAVNAEAAYRKDQRYIVYELADESGSALMLIGDGWELEHFETAVHEEPSDPTFTLELYSRERIESYRTDAESRRAAVELMKRAEPLRGCEALP